MTHFYYVHIQSELADDEFTDLTKAEEEDKTTDHSIVTTQEEIRRKQSTFAERAPEAGLKRKREQEVRAQVEAMNREYRRQHHHAAGDVDGEEEVMEEDAEGQEAENAVTPNRLAQIIIGTLVTRVVAKPAPSAAGGPSGGSSSGSDGQDDGLPTLEERDKMMEEERKALGAAKVQQIVESERYVTEHRCHQ